MSRAAPAITVVLVSWESGGELTRCLASLADARARAAGGGTEIELVVVDNASASFPLSEIRRLWPEALIEVNGENRGFGPAANQGAALASAPIVLFLNPDTTAVDEPFQPLVRGFAEHPEAVALAPRLLESGGAGEETQSAFQLRRLPTWRQALRELLLVDRIWPGNPGRRRDRYAAADRGGPFEVEQPAGAALAVRRAIFEEIGGFDEAFAPAWFEDVDLCARLRNRGTLLYWPASRFNHLGGVAASRLGYDAFLPIYYRNAHRYWRKHHGPGPAALFRGLLAAGMALRLLVLPARRRLPRPRREAARAYARVLGGALGLDRRFAIPKSVRAAWLRSADHP